MARRKASKRVRRKASKKAEPIYLVPEDLRQFLLRRGVVEQAATHLSMVQDSYRLWADSIRRRYSLDGLYDICPETGLVVPKEKVRG